MNHQRYRCRNGSILERVWLFLFFFFFFVVIFVDCQILPRSTSVVEPPVTPVVATAAGWLGSSFHRHERPDDHNHDAHRRPDYESVVPYVRGGSKILKPQSPSTTLKNPFRSLFLAVHEARQHLVAAAVGRASAVICCYPIETVKTRIQTSQSLPFRIRGLYGGVASSLVGLIPYTVLTFGSYEVYKKRLKEKLPQLRPAVTYALAAVLGDMTGSLWLCPPEVIKQRVQMGMYSSTFQGVTSIWKLEGIRGFYRGYIGSISRDVPFRVAQLTTYEVAKSFYLGLKAKKQETRKNGISGDDLTPVESAVLGGLAGVVSTVVTQPMDRIRTLLMTNGQLYGGSMSKCIKTILEQEGISGIYSGLLPRTLYIAPSVTIFFIAYEATIQRTKHW